eukprot:6926976-Lingulodinium_polyedra.AAC.1
MASATDIKEWVDSCSMLEQDEWFAQGGRTTQEPYHACIDRSQVETSWTHLKTIDKTKLTQGRLSMLVDLGSRINIIGCNTER